MSKISVTLTAAIFFCGSVFAEDVKVAESPAPPAPGVQAAAAAPAVPPAAVPPAPAEAAPAPPPSPRKEATVSDLEEKGAQAKIEPTRSAIWDYFSAGIIANIYPASGRVARAEIRDGTVRVLEKDFAQLGIGLQAFLPIPAITYLTSDDNEETWQFSSEHAFGPYVGASLETGDLIQSLALGAAYKYTRKEGAIVVGVGVVVDPVSQFLSTEFVEDQAAPVGAEGVHYQTRPDFGAQVMLSFSPGRSSD